MALIGTTESFNSLDGDYVGQNINVGFVEKPAV
mgnify:CR=1 FL=1